MLRDDVVQFVKLGIKFKKYCDSQTFESCTNGECILYDHTNGCCPFAHLDLAGQPFDWEFDKEVE